MPYYGSSSTNTQSLTTQSSSTSTTGTSTQNTLLFTYNQTLNTVRENPRFNYLNSNNNNDSCTSNPINCNKRYKSHFRMPINHWRKKTNCIKDCLPNETIIKHNENKCYKKQYVKTRFTDNCGFKILHKNLSTQQYLQQTQKSYHINAQGNVNFLKTNEPNSYYSLYQNKDNNTVLPCSITIKKLNNISHNTNSAVSGRERINRLKNKNNVYNKYNCTNKNCIVNNKVNVPMLNMGTFTCSPKHGRKNVKNKCE